MIKRHITMRSYSLGNGFRLWGSEMMLGWRARLSASDKGTAEGADSGPQEKKEVSLRPGARHGNAFYVL